MIKNLKAGYAALFALAISHSLFLGGCTPTTTGAVKDDLSITGQTQRLEATGGLYRGPEYNIAILHFDNRPPSRVIGVGEAAALIFSRRSMRPLRSMSVTMLVSTSNPAPSAVTSFATIKWTPLA